MYEVVADQVLGIYGPINGQVHIATRSFGNSLAISAQISSIFESGSGAFQISERQSALG